MAQQKYAKHLQTPRVIITCYRITMNILSTSLGREAIITICRQKHVLVIKNSHELLNMSRVEIVLVLMNGGEYESGLFIWSRCHSNTAGGKTWGTSCRGHVQNKFCIRNAK